MDPATQEILRVVKEAERLSEEIGELRLTVTDMVGEPGNFVRSGQMALDNAAMYLRRAGQMLSESRIVTVPSDNRDGFVRQRT